MRFKLTVFMSLASLIVTAACSKSSSSAGSSSAACTVGSTTGSSAVANAANTFLASLSSSQCTTAQQTMNLAHAEIWSNIPTNAATREGVQLADLSSTQQTAALAVAQAALSTTGYTLFSEIRNADEKLSQTNADTWGHYKYYIAILGTPSDTTPWILQITGHHIAYNLAYNANQVSGTPFFVGVEPVSWTDSTTHQPLETQRAAIDALAQTLVGNGATTLTGTFTDVVMGPNGTGAHDTNYPQSYPSTGRGLQGTSLSSPQRDLVKTAIEAWVNTMPSAIATSLLADYESSTSLDNTYVGLGLDGSNTVDFGASPSGLSSENSYLRIDGPRVWIEFVVQQGAADHSNIHYHSIWRDKTADYGGEF